MLTPSSGAVGFGRAFLWAVVVLALALTAHFEAGGHLPPAGVITLLGALLLVVTTLAVRRQIRWPGGLALAGLGQGALHQVFSFLGGACAPAPLPDGGAHAHLADPLAPVLAHEACAGAGPTGIDPGMLAWHLLATVVSVGLLLGVERGVWLLASWLVRPLSVQPLWLPVVRRVPVLVEPETSAGSVDLHVAPERGPPSSALVMDLAA
ncbi:hypothetical protein APR04_002555 [Promicromonospora umidemergens]|uniref:MFS transporter n=1 Tax=Promicromonospora umidemergens TaxID=629679 RepID=A0ABP8WWR2_9MICO|nr:hypothetical protein [Promicromonospora umidemergens]MCP2283647.1 hypothetical protein [Promicromonospora umidemergens]